MKKHGGKDIWNARMEWGSDVWEYIPKSMFDLIFLQKLGFERLTW